jgi:hypothetical protein
MRLMRLAERVGVERPGKNAEGRQAFRLATPLDGLLRGPDKYRILDLRRRRAQIRARRVLGLR